MELMSYIFSDGKMLRVCSTDFSSIVIIYSSRLKFGVAPTCGSSTADLRMGSEWSGPWLRLGFGKFLWWTLEDVTGEHVTSFVQILAKEEIHPFISSYEGLFPSLCLLRNLKSEWRYEYHYYCCSWWIIEPNRLPQMYFMSPAIFRILCIC